MAIKAAHCSQRAKPTRESTFLLNLNRFRIKSRLYSGFDLVLLLKS
jgi:hypothetical protein